MGGAMEVDLSHGALAAMSQLAEGLRPVLQVSGLRLAGVATERYRLVLSDGVHSQQGMLVTSMNHLVRDGALRDGTVIRVLDYICNSFQNRRIIIVIQLEILQTECALIRSPEIYDASATQPKSGFYSGGLGIHGPCIMMSGSEQGGNNLSCFPDQGLLGSSIAAGAEHSANNLQFCGSYGSMPTQNTIDANMQQLSLNYHQNQIFAVTATGGGFGPADNTCGSPAPHSYMLLPPICMNRGPVAKNEAAPRVVPISALNPYQGRWTIKARVTAKTDLRHYSNAKGTGKVFSFDLLDAQGGEIRATCFNLVADQFYDLIEVDKVYLMSRGSVKPAQKKFNPLNNDYEVTLDISTSIEICSGDDSSIPRQQYNFRQISEIENMDSDAMIDLVGVVTSVSPSGTIMRKNGTETQKRTLQLKDMSGRSVEITLWGNFCDAEGQQLRLQCDSGLNPILALKSGRVSDYSGRSVSTISSSQLKINPDFPEAERLRQWYITKGKTAACISLSREMPNMGRTDLWKTIAQIKDENLRRSDKPDFITVKAAISHVNTGALCYPACTLMFNGKQSNRKVINNDNGTWRCDRCNQSSETCEYRYLLMCQIQDHTGTTYATAFHEAGEEIIGRTAQELFTIKHVEEDDAQFSEIMHGILWHQYLFKLRIKEETINDDQRVKCSIVKAEKFDSLESHYLLGVIDNLLKADPCSTPEVQGGCFMGRFDGGSAGNTSSSECFKCNRGFMGRSHGSSASNTS